MLNVPVSEYGRVRSQAQMDAAGITVWLRPGEVLWMVVDPAAGPCRTCDTMLAAVQCCWDHRISTGPGYDGKPFEMGEDRFTTYRHASGAAPCTTFDIPQARCRACKTWDRDGDLFKLEQLAYHDRTTCRNCGDVWNGPDIGD